MIVIVSRLQPPRQTPDCHRHVEGVKVSGCGSPDAQSSAHSIWLVKFIIRAYKN